MATAFVECNRARRNADAVNAEARAGGAGFGRGTAGRGPPGRRVWVVRPSASEIVLAVHHQAGNVLAADPGGGELGVGLARQQVVAVRHGPGEPDAVEEF